MIEIVGKLQSESERQFATLLCWPYAGSDWDENLTEIQLAYAALTAVICKHSRVVMAYHPKYVVEADVLAKMTDASVNLAHLHCIPIPYNDTWVRDFGPIIVESDEASEKFSLLDFTFNGWGGKFEAKEDNAFCKQLSEHPIFSHLDYQKSDLILEGGGIEGDASKPLLTTKKILENPNRPGPYTVSDKINLLKQYTGVSDVKIFEHGHLINDDTDDHIDMLIRYGMNHSIAYVQCADKTDAHFESLQALASELRTWNEMQAVPYTLVPIPLPSPIFNHTGKRLPASYLNFIYGNDIVIVSEYGVVEDEIAKHALATIHPEHKIIGVNCLPFIQQGGALHCASMQLPLAAFSKDDKLIIFDEYK